MHFDFILENIIGDHRVACPFRKRGCDVVIPLTNISSHKRECDLNPDNLPDFLAHEASPLLQVSFIFTLILFINKFKHDA